MTPPWSTFREPVANLPLPLRCEGGRTLLALPQDHCPPKATVLPSEHLLRGQPSWPPFPPKRNKNNNNNNKNSSWVKGGHFGGSNFSPFETALL